jgi:hypothetical protein
MTRLIRTGPATGRKIAQYSLIFVASTTLSTGGLRATSLTESSAASTSPATSTALTFSPNALGRSVEVDPWHGQDILGRLGYLSWDNPLVSNLGAERLGLWLDDASPANAALHLSEVDAFDSGPGSAGSPVPEPTTLLLFGSGLAAGAAVLRRRMGRGKAA